MNDIETMRASGMSFGGLRIATLEAVALLDAMPDSTAVLAADGTIVAVNRAWRTFALENGGTPEATGVGINYLDVCSDAGVDGSPDAGEAESGIRAVLSGDVPEFVLEYACPLPVIGSWFVMRVTQIAGKETGALVSHVSVIRRKPAEKDLEPKSSEDPLTGLPDRALFSQRLTSALKLKGPRTALPDVGLVLIHLDGFKLVNETFGQAAGDQALQVVAIRLGALARPQDTVARLGGDEFAFLAPRINQDGLASIVKRITESLSHPHFIYGVQVELNASVGTYLASRGETVHDALQLAGEAMFAIKAHRTR